MKKNLVCGIPRSGTTWISKVLTYNNEVKYLHEPDNERQNLLGFIYKNKLDRFPFLRKDDYSQNYEILFRKAYSGYFTEPYGKVSNIIRDVFSLDLDELEQRIVRDKPNSELRSDAFSYLREELLRGAINIALNFSKIRSSMDRNYDKKIIKSVHCVLALEFLNNVLNINNTLLIFRHPASIVASHLRMDNKDIWRPIIRKNPLLDGMLQPFKSNIVELEDPLAKAGARIGAIYYLWEQQLQTNKWQVVIYEQVCRNKIQSFKDLYKKMDLDWNNDIESYIHRLNDEGGGYSVKRIAKKQVDKWQKELTPSEISSIKRGYQIFPLQLEYSFT